MSQPPREEPREPETWPELAVSLYDRLTGRGASITYEFEEMEIDVPNKTGSDADHARWRVDGTITVKTTDSTGGEPDDETPDTV